MAYTFTACRAVLNMWIHEHQDWPNLTWDAEALSLKLADLRYRQGYLLGRMESLGFEFRTEANLSILTHDAVKSSAIEGERLDPQHVRSSIARRLGIDVAGLAPSSREVEGMVDMMLDATRHFSKTLTKERLCDWHAALFPAGRSGMHRITVGAWRTKDAGPMQVVSGPIGREKIHFEAPDADRLESEMRVFLDWFDDQSISVDPLVKAGVAHFWLVTIHPFEDGNGRIARAVGDLALARAERISDRFYSLSSQIAAEQAEYYEQLERQQRGTTEITGWLEWFLDCLGRAISSADVVLDHVLFKSMLWDRVNRISAGERQRLVVNRMLDDDFIGHMNTSKYAKLAKCSNDTALRDIQSLKQHGIFIQNPSGGRSTSYRLPLLEEIKSG